MLNRSLHLFLGFLFLISTGLPDMLLSGEKILEYKSTIEVNIDGILDITEEITVFAEGHQIKRGIYRDFPTTYIDRAGNRIRVDFTVQEVLRDGFPERYIV